MAKITYMPTAADNDVTVVDGITFPAYQAVDVPDERQYLIRALGDNPWFTAGDVDADRHDAWNKVRAAQTTANELRAEAERLAGKHS